MTPRITSPNYPSNYPDKANCSWLIVAPKGRRLIIDFKDFNTKLSDNLEIYDGPSADFIRIGTFQGKLVPSVFPPQVSSSKESLHLVFNSDGLIHAKGFQIEFRIFEGKM